MARPVPVTRSAEPRAGAPVARRSRAAASPSAVSASASSSLRVRDKDDEEEEIQTSEKAIRSAPPWLVSAVVHMSILIVLGLLYFTADRDKQLYIEAVYAEDLGEQLEEDLLQMAELEIPKVEIADPVFSKDLTFANDPLAAPPQLDFSVLANTSSSDIEAPSIGIALTGREKGAKEALLAAYGGTAKTEAAVQSALEWLAKQQDLRTGLWSLTGPFTDGAPAGMENQLAATAMALLAFQGAGNTHKTGKHKRVVQRGVDALVRLQDREGNCWRQGPHNQHLYSQAQATIALCELYGMSKDPKYRKPAQLALDYASRVQCPTLGGWRYNPQRDSDTSVTGWFVMALRSGQMAELSVQSPTLDGVGRFLDRVTTDGTFYSYKIGEEPKLKPVPTMTAEALLCRQYQGWDRDDIRLRKGVDFLLENPIDYDEHEDVYYWYYATQVLHHMGGEDWDRWNEVMREVVPERQVKQGRERGSWSPAGDRWGHIGGRLYATCLSTYLLEVYYRHLPIYRH